MSDRSKAFAIFRMPAAAFARLSPSMQLALLAIRRAQSSSRKAVAAAAHSGKRPSDA